MSETIIENGLEAIEAAFDNFMETDVADVELNVNFPEGVYLFRFAEYTKENDADKLYKSILSERMIEQATSRGQEPKALGIVRLHMQVEQVIQTDHEDPASCVGKTHVEEIPIGERSIGQLLKLAAAILDKTPQELKPALAGTKMPDLVDTFAGQQIVATVKHRKAKGDSDFVNVEIDYSRKAVLCSVEAYQNMQSV